MRFHTITAVLVGGALFSVAFAAEPPPELPPIGDRENKTYLPVLTLPSAKYGRQVIIRPLSDWGRPKYSLRRKSPEEKWRLGIGLDRYVGVVPPLTGGAGPYRITEKDVIPILGEMYLVRSTSEKSITIEVITDQLPKSLRPNTKARILCLGSGQVPFFEQRIDVYDQGIVEVLEIERPQDKKGNLEAVLKVYSPRPTPRDKYADPFKVTVQEGDVLVMGKGEYRIQRIVPPQQVELKMRLTNPDGMAISGPSEDCVGNIVGWIEVDAEPAKDEAGNLITRPVDDDRSN